MSSIMKPALNAVGIMVFVCVELCLASVLGFAALMILFVGKCEVEEDELLDILVTNSPAPPTPRSDSALCLAAVKTTPVQYSPNLVEMTSTLSALSVKTGKKRPCEDKISVYEARKAAKGMTQYALRGECLPTDPLRNPRPAPESDFSQPPKLPKILKEEIPRMLNPNHRRIGPLLGVRPVWRSHDPIELAETLYENANTDPYLSEKQRAAVINFSAWRLWYEKAYNEFYRTSHRSKNVTAPIPVAQMDYLIQLFNTIFFFDSLPPISFCWSPRLLQGERGLTFGQSLTPRYAGGRPAIEIDPIKYFHFPFPRRSNTPFEGHISTLLHELVHIYLEYYSCPGSCNQRTCTGMLYRTVR